MLLLPDAKTKECYERAARARELADKCTDPLQRTDFLHSEERWLKLGETYQFTAGLPDFLKAPKPSLYPRCVVCAVPMSLANVEHVPGEPARNYSTYECKVCDAKLVLPEATGG
jgi:hypothetical protein